MVKTATRVSLGRIVTNISRSLAKMPTAPSAMPVISPPGSARLCTKPLATVCR